MLPFGRIWRTRTRMESRSLWSPFILLLWTRPLIRSFSWTNMPKLAKPCTFALVDIPFVNIGKITSCSQPVDQDIIDVIILHFLTPHTSVRAYCCDMVLYRQRYALLVLRCMIINGRLKVKYTCYIYRSCPWRISPGTVLRSYPDHREQRSGRQMLILRH